MKMAGTDLDHDLAGGFGMEPNDSANGDHEESRQGDRNVVSLAADSSIPGNAHLLVLEAVLEAVESPSFIHDRIAQIVEALTSLDWGPAKEKVSGVLLEADYAGNWRSVTTGPENFDLHGCCPEFPVTAEDLESVLTGRSAFVIPGGSSDCSSAPLTDSCYCLPIYLGGDELYGVMLLKIPGEYQCSSDDERLLRVAAKMVGRMIERDKLGQENRKLSRQLIGIQEQEYRKLAREIHDEFGQSLTAIKTDAVLISSRSKDREHSIYRSSEAIIAVVSHIYDVVYSMMRRLRPTVLDDLGLLATLESYMKDWRERRPGMPCRLTISGEIDGFEEDVNISIYRMIQECTTNVIRHAAASRIHVMLVRVTTEKDDHVVVSVEDNGRGMTRTHRHSGSGFGLLGMRERVESLGGEMQVQSARNRGTTVVALIPVSKSSDRSAKAAPKGSM
ncbi:MAG: sensor histidine kinase [Gammaproteobacteria bacterium]|nr:sensor histidine kinase [Gammaproteobacteria bacterium]